MRAGRLGTASRFETERRKRCVAARPRRLRLVADLSSVRVMFAGARADIRGAGDPRNWQGSDSGGIPARRPLCSDLRGVVIVEYVVVLLLVSMFACGARLVLGMAMSKFFFSQQAWIGIPLP